MKKKFWWIIIGVVVVIILLILLIPKKKLVSFDGFEFPETVKVENSTDYKIDTISMILANKVFEWDSLRLILFYLPELDNDEVEFKGIVQQLPFVQNSYLLLLNRNLGFDEVLTVLSHEFIHIEQYKTKRLVVSGKEYWWEGEYGVFDSYDTSRPFEVEAFSGQSKVKKELKKIIYE